MNIPWANRVSPEIRIEFVEKTKNPNCVLKELCHEYKISRPTAYKWIAAYQDGNYLCVNCNKNYFFFLESKLCIPCKKLYSERKQEEYNSEKRKALRRKQSDYARMDELYSQGILRKSEVMNIEGITILEYYEQGKTTKEIKNIFNEDLSWIQRRLTKLGTSIRECQRNYKSTRLELQKQKHLRDTHIDKTVIRAKLKKMEGEIRYIKKILRRNTNTVRKKERLYKNGKRNLVRRREKHNNDTPIRK